ncbi:MAG: hypothetical protein RIS29_3122 [Bacteroidota bacterium]
MKKSIHFPTLSLRSTLFVLLYFCVVLPGYANPLVYVEIKGQVIDKKSGEPLAFASLSVAGTNISIVSNSEGLFVLKLPHENSSSQVTVSYIGYKQKLLPVSDLKPDKNKILMEPSSVQLPELHVVSKDASEMVKMMLANKTKNLQVDPGLMTAFYRETIKKNRSYASLSEAVVEIAKKAYNDNRPDVVALYKSRKRTDYARLDTLSFKLMGGPFNTLYLDVMKYPEVLFTEDMMSNYEFSFDKSLFVGKTPVYVIDFKQRPAVAEPLYYGKLYIDGRNYALRSAVFYLNLNQRDEAAAMFIMKKPLNAKIYPIEAKYRVDYIEKDDKWIFNYSRIELGLKIVWKKKLFNTTYHSTVEMAVTDWGEHVEKRSIERKDRLRPSVIIQDEASGFSDPGFWGEFNVIEPEKPIESAIRKIQKQLDSAL